MICRQTKKNFLPPPPFTGPAHTDQPSQTEMAVMPKIATLCSPSLPFFFYFFSSPVRRVSCSVLLLTLCSARAKYLLHPGQGGVNKGGEKKNKGWWMLCTWRTEYRVRRTAYGLQIQQRGVSCKGRHDLQPGHPPSSTRSLVHYTESARSTS